MRKLIALTLYYFEKRQPTDIQTQKGRICPSQGAKDEEGKESQMHNGILPTWPTSSAKHSQLLKITCRTRLYSSLLVGMLNLSLQSA